MKRIIALLLALVMTAGFLCACDTLHADEEYVGEVVFQKEADGTVKLPAVPTRQGLNFRGWYTEAEGKGVKITDATVVEGDSLVGYEYWTETVENPEVLFIAFGSHPYDHAKFIDPIDGKERDIAYRGYEEDYRLMKEFGMDIVFMDYYQNAGTQTLDCDQNIKWCEQYGLECFICDGATHKENVDKAYLDTVTAPYINSPAFRGFYLGDEPGMSQLAEFRRWADCLRAAYPDKDCHINLCTLELIAPLTTLVTYYKYFTDHISADHIASDPYPYGNSSDDSHVYESFFTELNTIARSSRDCERPLWLYVQVANNFDNPMKKLKYNVYADLTYGTTGYVIFLYQLTHINNAPMVAGTSTSAMFDLNGSRNVSWYAGQQIVKELRYFSDVYEKYAWKIGGSVLSESGKNTAAVKKAIPYGGTVITDVKADAGIIVSDFVERNGDGSAFCIFNAANQALNLVETVTFKVPGAKSVTAYVDMTTTVLTPDANGVYTLQIPVAEAVFVTVEHY